MTAPQPEAWCIAAAIWDDEISMDEAVQRIDAALTAARADERERACKAVCRLCAKGAPFSKAEPLLHVCTDDAGIRFPCECRAAAIRAMGDYALCHDEEGR